MTAPSLLLVAANRGMGIEYARQYAAEGWRVFATCRDPASAADLQAVAAAFSNLTIHAMDLIDQSSIDRLASELAGVALDVVLVNASHMIAPARQCFGATEYAEYVRSYEVNALGPLRVATAFIDHVRAGTHKKLMFMGSAAGSTGGLQAPYMMFAYCGAKSALHNMVRGLHLNLRDEGITVGLLEPGVVDTQGFRQVQPGEPAPYGLDHVVELVREGKLTFADPEEAVAGLRRLIADMTPAQGGRLTRVDGEVLPW